MTINTPTVAPFAHKTREQQLLEEANAHKARDRATRGPIEEGSREHQLLSESDEHEKRDRSTRNG